MSWYLPRITVPEVETIRGSPFSPNILGFSGIFFMMSAWLSLLNPCGNEYSALPASEGREPFLRFSVASGSMPSFIPKQHSGCVGPPAKQAPMEQKVCQCRQEWASRGLQGRKAVSPRHDTGSFSGPGPFGTVSPGSEVTLTPRFTSWIHWACHLSDYLAHKGRIGWMSLFGSFLYLTPEYIPM